ncbi:SprT-like protein [Salirhabdus euzebyi]|uniref:Protein SprT-like n=1 Tax=Salirhabdus euzebyi TaxID=394506 RepID=A0A841Q6P4_9BACI|nr:SprT family protein [Salirhabdus euzebyi]MBB6454199.1 SprT-like protein [Salirhabdus euzebyi]
MNNKELTDLVNEISIKYFHKKFADKAIFNSRLQTTGGRYMLAKRVIEINPKYLEELGMEELIGIIKHELCHYHLHIEGKGYRHMDQDFKQLLVQTNSPRHCSFLPSQKREVNHVYRCVQCGYTYRRVRKVNVTKYRCGKCKGRLKKD